MILARKLLIKLSQIRNIIDLHKSDIKKWNGVWLIETQNHIPTFSFLNYIFYGAKSIESHSDKIRILNHEFAHIKQGHTYDILFIEVLQIVFWFNPIFILYKKSLEEVHEYLADERAVESHQDTEAYISLLAKQAMNNLNVGLVQHFSKSTILNRITMMQMPKTQNSSKKAWLVLPVLSLLIAIVSCDPMVAELESENQVALGNELLQAQDIKITIIAPDPSKKDYTQINGNRIEARKGSYLVVGENLKNEKERDAFFQILESLPSQTAEGANSKRISTSANPSLSLPDGVFDYVETMPEPKNGMSGFYAFVNQNLKYPQSAKNMGIEGKVFIMFNIYEDGSIHDVQIVKGIHPECDAEALRVVQESPAWNPGMQRGRAVKTRMRLPITFKMR